MFADLFLENFLSFVEAARCSPAQALPESLGKAYVCLTFVKKKGSHSSKSPSRKLAIAQWHARSWKIIKQ